MKLCTHKLLQTAYVLVRKTQDTCQVDQAFAYDVHTFGNDARLNG